MTVCRESRNLLICKEALVSCRTSQSGLVYQNSSYVEIVKMTAVRQLLSEHNENRSTALECLELALVSMVFHAEICNTLIGFMLT